MVECSIVANVDEAFDKCWNVFINTLEGKEFLEKSSKHLLELCKKFSPDL
jgi:hypothetical protein